MPKNQAWFDEEYSLERSKLRSIRIIGGGDFKGQLVVNNYSKLEKFFLRDFTSINRVVLENLIHLRECTIWDCSIKDLVIINCPEIRKLNLSNNLLTNLQFLESLSNLAEIDLNISSNNFSESSLRPFSRMTNLTSLNIGNPLSRRIFFRTYNRFTGSLSPLQNVSRLRDLDVSNTDIDRRGLEKLPDSLEKISCSSDYLLSWIKENNCSQIVQELRNYWISGNCYDLASWRTSQPFFEEVENSNRLLQRRDETVRERNTRVAELEQQLETEEQKLHAQIQTPPKNKISF